MANLRIDPIQGLRGAAALLVVVDHSVSTLVQKAGESSEYEAIAWLLGGMGVKIFFMISGFIMTVSAHDQFGAPGARSSFLVRRLVRVAPMYWLTTLIYAAKLALQDSAPSLTHLIKSLGFIPYRDSAGAFEPVYGVGWTLNYEMFFYLLFAVSLTWRIRVGTLILAALLIGLVGLSAGIAGAHEAKNFELLEFFGNAIILYFLGGIVIGLLRLRLALSGNLLPLDIRGALGLAIPCFFAYAGWLILAKSRGAAFPSVVPFCALPVLLCALARDTSEGGQFRRIASRLGDASFSIYLTHNFLIGPAGRLWSRLPFSLGSIFFIVAMIVACSVFGWLVYLAIEKPLLRYCRSLLSGEKSSIST